MQSLKSRRGDPSKSSSLLGPFSSVYVDERGLYAPPWMQRPRKRAFRPTLKVAPVLQTTNSQTFRLLLSADFSAQCFLNGDLSCPAWPSPDLDNVKDARHEWGRMCVSKFLRQSLSNEALVPEAITSCEGQAFDKLA
jgi:hypothetical protein